MVAQRVSGEGKQVLGVGAGWCGKGFDCEMCGIEKEWVFGALEGPAMGNDV